MFESEFVLDAQNRVARFRVMGNRTELEAGDRRVRAPALHLSVAVRRRHDRHQRGRHPARPAGRSRRVRNALAHGARGHGAAARRPLSGRDRAARQRDQRADREQPAHRRALAHAGRQPRPFAEDAARGAAQRGPRARRRQGPADRRPGGAPCRSRSSTICSGRASPRSATASSTARRWRRCCSGWCG